MLSSFISVSHKDPHHFHDILILLKSQQLQVCLWYYMLLGKLFFYWILSREIMESHSGTMRQWTDLQSAGWPESSYNGSNGLITFHFDSVIHIQTKPDKIGQLVTEFYSGQDRHTTHTHWRIQILGWPRASSGQQWHYGLLLSDSTLLETISSLDCRRKTNQTHNC